MAAYKGPKIYERNGIWYAWIQGERVSTKCRGKDAAQVAALELERRAAMGANYKASYSFAQAARAFHDTFEGLVLDGVRSSETAEMYKQKVLHLARVLGAGVELDSIGFEQVDSFVKTRRSEGAHPGTIGKELTTLRRILKHAKRLGKYEHELLAVFPEVAVGSKYIPRSAWLTAVELAALMVELPVNRQRVVAFIVATSAEWRAVESAQAEDLGKTSCLIRGTKNKRRWRTVPILPPFYGLWPVVLSGAPQKGPAFDPWASVGRDLARACKRAGVPRITPNDLRRTYGKWLRLLGVPPQLIAPGMGHVDSRMVERVYGAVPAEQLRSTIEPFLKDAGPVDDSRTVQIQHST